jgi:hypothetical protein
MIPENFKTSLLIDQQLPSFIRDNKDYVVFIDFLEAYYEFLESNGNVLSETKKLLSYKDIDDTVDKFEEYFFNEFLQYFPQESLTDKRELVKFSRELYQRKSTLASFKFLFRSLYDADSEILNAKDYVLIASGGKWNTSKYLRLNTIDSRFLQTKFYKIFGESTKSVAKIDNVQIISNRTEIYLSDLVRNFVSGEFIKVVDDQLKDVLFDGEVLRAKIVGIVPRISIVPGYEGSGYEVGDPVLVIGGVNPESENPTRATAEVSSVGLSSIQEISVINGGNGFRRYPNTTITIGAPGTGADARVSGLDASNPATIEYLLLTDIVGNYYDVNIDDTAYGLNTNPSANANTVLVDAFEAIDTIETYPIATIQVVAGGLNYDTTTKVTPTSIIEVANTVYDIGQIGILAPIKIRYGGANYSNGDIVLINGGSGFGAYANVAEVDSVGSIQRVQYVIDPNKLFTLGGIKYTLDNLPTISVESANNKVLYLISSNASSSSTNVIYFANTSNIKPGMYISGTGIPTANTFGYFDSATVVESVESSYIVISNGLTQEVSNNSLYKIDGTSLLYVDNILGKGTDLRVTPDRIGQIKTITVTNPGEDYISSPTIALKIVDVLLINVEESLLPEEGELIYQGDATRPSFRGTVYSIVAVGEEIIRTFKIRIYSFVGTINPDLNLYIDRTAMNSREITLQIRNTYNLSGYVNGINFFGDGLARANADFVSGIIQNSGQYINSDGFISYSNFLESETVNDYSYFTIVQKAFSRYKTILTNLLHPAGKQAVIYNNVGTSKLIDISVGTGINTEQLLNSLTRPQVYGVLSEPSKLVIYELRKDLTGISLDDVISENNYIHLESDNGEVFYSPISSIDNANDIIYLTDGNILEYANVMHGYADGTSNAIFVTDVTTSFDLINGGNYSNTSNKLIDIVFDGDQISVPNNSIVTINKVDYSNNIIYANSTLYYSGTNTDPVLISVIRNFSANNIWINYNL